MSKTVDIALVIRAPASRFPPTINQANILAEQGYRVGILEVSAGGEVEAGPFRAAVSRESVGKATDFNQSLPGVRQRWESRRSFINQTARKLEEIRPRVTIAYDSDSVFGAARWAKTDGAFSVAHFHELPDETGDRRLAAWRMKRLRKALRDFDLTIFPDPFRAAAFMAKWDFRPEPLVVYNCVRRKNSLKPVPFPGVPEGKQVVLYQGVISASRGVLHVLQSIPWWPADAHLVLRGIVVNEFAEQLDAEARRLGVAGRVHVMHQAAYGGDTVDIAAAAHVGVALYQGDQDINTRFSAFASNKIFEYAAAGIPVLAPDAFGYRELIDLQQIGECVNPRDARAIGEAVARLLNDRQRWRAMSDEAREAHLRALNYERQFNPVLERIAVHLGKGRG